MTRKRDDPKRPPVVTYENADRAPGYVEAAEGVVTPSGALQVSFYSTYLRQKERIEGELTVGPADGSGSTTVNIVFGDPFGLDSNEPHIVRRVEATLVFPAPAVRSLINWLQLKLAEMEKKGDANATVSTTS